MKKTERPSTLSAAECCLTGALFDAVNPAGVRLVFGSGGKHHDCRTEAELRHMLEFVSFDLLIVHEGAVRAAQICQHS